MIFHTEFIFNSFAYSVFVVFFLYLYGILVSQWFTLTHVLTNKHTFSFAAYSFELIHTFSGNFMCLLTNCIVCGSIFLPFSPSFLCVLFFVFLPEVVLWVFCLLKIYCCEKLVKIIKNVAGNE